MNMQDWLNNTPWVEIVESLDATDGTIYELLGEYMRIYPTSIHESLKHMLIYKEFEDMLEAAKDYHEEEAANNETCPKCNDNGMDCYHCGGTGKRPDYGDHKYEAHRDEELIEIREREQ